VATSSKVVATCPDPNVAFRAETLEPEGGPRAVSSVVEHYLDTVGVTGSNPVSRTIFLFISLYILPCLT
jgi:hypothetical protein